MGVVTGGGIREGRSDLYYSKEKEMPWPKGMKRVGHVNKDGTPHRKKGEGLRVQVIRKDKPAMTIQAIKSDPKVMTVTKEVHGMTGQAVIEPCPSCGYAYADGGWCPECGVTSHSPDCRCQKGARA